MVLFLIFDGMKLSLQRFLMKSAQWKVSFIKYSSLATVSMNISDTRLVAYLH